MRNKKNILNKRGFSLIELLAVIIILGIIMIFTIPRITETIKKTKQESYEKALAIIQKYATAERVKCLMDPESIDDYNSEIFDTDCNLIDSENTSNIILRETKYMNDISGILLDDTDGDGEYEVIYAPVTKDGNFDGVDVKGEIDRPPIVIPPFIRR